MEIAQSRVLEFDLGITTIPEREPIIQLDKSRDRGAFTFLPQF